MSKEALSRLLANLDRVSEQAVSTYRTQHQSANLHVLYIDEKTLSSNSLNTSKVRATLLARCLEKGIPASEYNPDSASSIIRALYNHSGYSAASKGLAGMRDTELVFSSYASIREFMNKEILAKGRFSTLLDVLQNTRSDSNITKKVAEYLGVTPEVLKKLVTDKDFQPSNIRNMIAQQRADAQTPEEVAKFNQMYNDIYSDPAVKSWDVGHTLPIAFDMVKIEGIDSLSEFDRSVLDEAISKSKKLGNTSSVMSLLERTTKSVNKTYDVVTSVEKSSIVDLSSGSKMTLVYTIPELTTKNLGKSEAQAKRQLIDSLREQLLKTDVTQVQGSPSFKEDITEALVEALQGKAPKPRKRKSTASKTTKQKAGNVKVTKTRVSSQVNTPSSGFSTLRNIRGQFTSVTKLENILRAAITDTVEGNMHRPYLMYQTGRFSESVSIQKVTRTREDQIKVFYTYMKYPYQTFEPGFRQGHKGYDPRLLISKSIRDILITQVKANITTERI